MDRMFVPVFVCIAVGGLSTALVGCGASGLMGDSGSFGAGADYARSNDPLERPAKVAWTSARASRCGFFFNPDQLRASYLAYERAYGHGQIKMGEIEKAYDYTRESVLIGAKKDPEYCTKDRVEETRGDLNRYLAGDFTTVAR